MVKKKEIEKINITLERKNGNIYIFLKIPQKMEKFFMSISNNEKQTSTQWLLKNKTGAEFYVLNSEYITLERKLENHLNHYFNDYGDGLFRDNRINLAILRTVGASQGIRIECNKSWGLNNIDLENYIRDLGAFTKKLWENVIMSQKIKAIISFEI